MSGFYSRTQLNTLRQHIILTCTKFLPENHRLRQITPEDYKFKNVATGDDGVAAFKK